MSFEFDASDLLKHLSNKEAVIDRVSIQRMHDCTDDLARISSNIAPIKNATLRRSVDTNVTQEGREIIGEVTFSATEEDGDGRFNYALWTHEEEYELGEISEQAPGTDGYEVGNKYLERPLVGESKKYVKWLFEGIRDGINE